MCKTGDLIFVKNKGWLFDCIRGTLGSEYDHVGMLYVGDTIMVIDATPLSGVSFRSIADFRNCDRKIMRLKAPYQKHIDKMIEYCKKNVGKKYDVLQAVCLYIMLLLKIKRKVEPVDIENAFVCSELISQAAEYSGFSFAKRKIATDRITPADLAKSGKLFEIT
jgi:uncharacterized protein YycO